MPDPNPKKIDRSRQRIVPYATLLSRDGDEHLLPEELERLTLFSNLRRQIPFEEYPGYFVLRRYSPGELVVRQGDPAHTAFYILTPREL
ncbi:MAG: hypothetical protein KDA84_30425, partial [Planctomycetaceae bacterium]|nr:hypothetical protein [Planctomycetaceae bacterium]